MGALTINSNLSGQGSTRLIAPQSQQIFRLAAKARRMGSSKAADQLVLAGAQSELAGGGGIGSVDSDMREQDLQGTMNQGLMESRRRAVLSPGGYVDESGGEPVQRSGQGLQEGVTQNASGGLLNARLDLQRRMQAAGAGSADQFQGEAAKLGISRSGFNQVASKLGAGGAAAAGGAAPAASGGYTPEQTTYDQYGANTIPASGTPPKAAGQGQQYPGVKFPAGGGGGTATAPAVAGTAQSVAPAVDSGEQRRAKLQQDTINQVREASAANPNVTRESALEAINKQRYSEGKGAVTVDWKEVAAADRAEKESATANKGMAAKLGSLASSVGSNVSTTGLGQNQSLTLTKPTTTGETTAEAKPSAVAQPALYQLGAGVREAGGALGSGLAAVGRAIGGAVAATPKVVGDVALSTGRGIGDVAAGITGGKSSLEEAEARRRKMLGGGQ